MQTAPESIDVTDFKFQLSHRLRIFSNNNVSLFNKPCNIIAAASRYGLIFVGTTQPLIQVIFIKEIESYSIKNGEAKDYAFRPLSIPSVATHISVNCDGSLLSVITEVNGFCTAIIYQTESFLNADIAILRTVQLTATPGVQILEIGWNPTIPGVFTVCKSDGSLGIYEFKPTTVETFQLPPEAGTTCFCWSPKGKQIAVGSLNGNITQYKPDLKAVKVIPLPPSQTIPLSIINLQWVSNYQFIGIYKMNDAENQCCLIVVDAPKAGQIVYTNYEDICYSYGKNRPIQFYTNLIQQWNTLIVSSSNSIEVGVIAHTRGGDTWTQYIIQDSARAELPLSPTKQDTYPVGVTIDNSSTVTPSSSVTAGSDDTPLPPVPYLLLLSHEGVLSVFSVVHLAAGGMAPVCITPEAVTGRTGLGLYRKIAPLPQPPQIEPPKQPPPPPQYQSPQSQPPPPQFQPQATPPQYQQIPPQYPPQTQPQISSQPLIKVPSVPSFGGGSPFGNVTQTVVQSPLLPNTALAPSFNTQQAGKQEPQQQQQQQSVTFLPQNTLLSKPLQSNQQQSTMPLLFNQTSQTSSFVTPQTKTTVSNQVINPNSQVGNIVQPTIVPQKTPQEVEDTTIVIPNNEDTQAKIATLVRENCIALEVQLKALLLESSKIEVNIGSEKESGDMVRGINELKTFMEELTEISATQATEIHVLKQNVIQTWSWYEDARSRFTIYNDPTMAALLRYQPLDPASERQLAEVRHLVHYLESQLLQANKSLDEQWDLFQESCKQSHKVRLPSIEMIYQTMVKHNATLQKQVYVMKDISTRILSRRQTKSIPNLLLNSLQSMDNLETSLKDLQIDPSELINAQYNRISARQSKFSTKKHSTLKEILAKRAVNNVAVTKPKLNDSRAQLSTLLAAPISPIAKSKQLLPQKFELDFIQSTPKPTKNLTHMGLKNISTPPPVFQQEVVKKPAPFSVISTANTESSAFVSTSQPKPTQFGTNLPKSVTAQPTKPVITVPKVATSQQAGSLITPPAFGGTTAFFGGGKHGISDITPPGTGNVGIFGTATPVNLFKPKKTEESSTAPFSFTNNTAIKTPSSSSGITITSIDPKKPLFGTPTSLESTFGLKPTQSTNPTSSTTGFGVATTIATVQSFGSTTIMPAGSLFGNNPTTVVTSAPIFGNNPTNTSNVLTSANSPVVITPSTGKVGSTINIAPSSTNIFAAAATSFINSSATTTTTNTNVIQVNTNVGQTNANIGLANANLGQVNANIGQTNANLGQTNANIVQTNANVGLANTSIVQSTTSGGLLSTPPNSNQFTAISAVSTSETTPANKPLFSVLPTGTTTPNTNNLVTSNTSNLVTSNPSNLVTPNTSILVTPFQPAVVTSTTSNLFASTTTTSNVFDSGTTIKPVGSLFGATPPTAVSSSSGTFGSTGSSIFGAVATATTSSAAPPIFGTSATTSSNIFAGSTSVTSASIFGATPPTSGIFSSQPSGIFGGGGTAKTTISPFGGVPTTSSSNIFGGATSTSSNIFGSTTTTTANIFGNSNTSTTTSNIFGGSTPSSTSTSIFGGTPTTGGIFGGSTQTTQSSSIFGQPAAFGASPATPSVFGGGGSQPAAAASVAAFATNTSVFGKPSVFGAAAATTQANVFGSATTTTFGNDSQANSLSFGGLNVATSAGFGQSPPPANANPFQRSTGGTTTTSFGGGSLFGSTQNTSPFSTSQTAATSTSSIFGQSSTSFGQAAPTAAAGGNIFGGGASFGGGGGSAKPGAPVGGGGAFSSGGGGSISQSGFGSPQQTAAGGFGAAPSFGGTPAAVGGQSPGGFGQSPSFGGGVSAFGSTPTFGSPGKMFGSPQAAPPTQQQNSTFANLATQNTLGFGNLAQSSPTTQASSGFSGGSSFSSWR